MMTDRHIDSIACAIQAVFTAVQPDEVFRWISLALTLLTGLVGLAYRLYHWYKEAKADGKITADEIKQATEIVKEDTDKLIDSAKQGIDEINKGKQDNNTKK